MASEDDARLPRLPADRRELLELVGYQPALGLAGRSFEEVLAEVRAAHTRRLEERAEALRSSGHSGIGGVLASMAKGTGGQTESLVPWLLALEAADLEAVWRAAIALAWAVLPAREKRSPDEVEARRAIEAGERALVRPGKEHAVASAKAARAVRGLGPIPSGPIRPRAFPLELATGSIVRAAANPASDRMMRLVGGHWFAGYPISREHHPEEAAEYLDDEALVAAVRAELVPWLLGEADPVDARVAAR